ncbi:MAG: phosphoglucosamine mutase [Candidatus Margulisiibacteriota bacterium]
MSNPNCRHHGARTKSRRRSSCYRIFLNEEQARKLIRIYEHKKFSTAPPQKLSNNPSAIATHIRRVIKTVNVSKIKKRKFRVVVDACNGAGSAALPNLLEKLGCRVLPLNCNPSLPFPHPPEPTSENLNELKKIVKEKNADLGIALDSDADRLALVSEKGEAIGEELTLALAIKFVLENHKFLSARRKIVVVNLSTSQAIDDLCKEYGVVLLRTKVGEVHVAEELKNLKGIIGGEGNGGVIYPPVGFNRDSLAAAALILNYLASSKKKLSELVGEIPAYQMVKSKIKCHNLDEAYEFMAKIKSLFKDQDLILTEGIKAIFPGAWIHVRPSNTEPILRIIAEAKEKEEAKQLIRKVFQALGQNTAGNI